MSAPRPWRAMLAALLLSLCLPAFAGTLEPKDAAAIQAEVKVMYEAYQKGNLELLLDKTHPSLPQAVGGREAYAKQARALLAQIEAMGVKWESMEVGMPGDTIPAGDEEICFVPLVSVLEMRKLRVRTTSFMIAIRTVGKQDWTYLDGTPLKEHPEWLYQLLPKLEPGVVLPPNEMKLI